MIANPSRAPVNHRIDQLPVSALRGVGPKMAERLHKLGISSVQDLLFHLPLRYQDRTRISAIAQLVAGKEAVIEGTVQSVNIAFGRRRSLACQLADDSGALTLRFFHFNSQQKNNLQAGTRLRCYGEVRRGATGMEIYHPEYQRIDDSGAGLSLAQGLTPIYPSTEGINQTSWRKLVAQALTLLDQHKPAELLPQGTANFPVSLCRALRSLHAPPADADQTQLALGEHPAQKRLIVEELVAHHLGLLNMRQRIRAHGAPALAPDPGLAETFLSQLPFSPTTAQQRVVAEIAGDLAQPLPMLRLVQGDVGSGKTLVAALAALQAVSAGHQVAIMAPTEILAQQHLHNFKSWFEPLDIPIAWLVGRLKGKARDIERAAIAEGRAAVAIGTHALFQDDVSFHRLGLVIIDEQHRFGVHQRLQLRDKGAQGTLGPHQLVMTATPIPRTLAMTAYADLDCSVIDELPPGRRPVTTVAVASSRREEVLERVRAACSSGAQVYWVCTLIEESETLQAQAAEVTAAELNDALPELEVALVHGRMKATQKNAVMDSFKAGEIHLLVATTVIEVGVDVPNANLMIIENPERLGLSQLHQLRGRVGRGSRQSHCVLLYQAPLSQSGKARIQAMRESSDGFVIAERDLELRGPGEVLGTRQTGMMAFKVADLQRDQHLIETVRRTAQLIAERYPERVEALIRRWIPQGDLYAQI